MKSISTGHLFFLNIPLIVFFIIIMSEMAVPIFAFQNPNLDSGGDGGNSLPLVQGSDEGQDSIDLKKKNELKELIESGKKLKKKYTGKFKEEKDTIQPEQIVLALGEEKTLSFSNRIWVENGKLLKAVYNKRGDILLKPLQIGSTNIHWKELTYSVQIIHPNQKKTFENFLSLSHSLYNLVPKVKDGKIHLKGRLVRWEDWKKISFLCHEINCQYLSSYSTNVEIQKKISENINGLIIRRGIPSLHFQFGETIFVRISEKSPYKNEYLELLGPYGIEVKEDPSLVQLEPLIKVSITLAEIKKAHILKYGIEWPNTLKFQTHPQPKINEDVNQNLQLLESNGEGRILARPNILCRSGKEAEFFAGGEFPIKVLNYKIQNTIWKRYGVLLKFKPEADFRGNMRLNIETEVSNIDSSRVVDGVPALFTHHIQSHFDLNKTKTVALSGLIKNEEGQNMNGWPGLSKIPILGSLFSSQDFQKNQSELVVFVRPEIVSQNSQDPDDNGN